MMSEQRDLVVQAKRSLEAAELMYKEGYYGFAASRAYYSMFYVAEAFLLGKGIAFSKHRGVHNAFAEHFVRTGIAPPEFHKYLTRGMEVRHVGDYGSEEKVSEEESTEQIARAKQFIELAERLIGPIPPSHADKT